MNLNKHYPTPPLKKQNKTKQNFTCVDIWIKTVIITQVQDNTGAGVTVLYNTF